MSNKKRKRKKTVAAPESKKPDSLIIVLACALVVALAFMIASLIAVNKVNSLLNETAPRETLKFVPPSFSEDFEYGAPKVPDDKVHSYREIYKDGMTFTSYICGEVVIENGSADVYFTNPKGNSVWMKLRVFNSKGDVIAETGLIRPNEYIKSVKFDTIPENGEKIVMKIMTYEPYTYESAGAVPLNTTAIVK